MSACPVQVPSAISCKCFTNYVIYKSSYFMITFDVLVVKTHRRQIFLTSPAAASDLFAIHKQCSGSVFALWNTSRGVFTYIVVTSRISVWVQNELEYVPYLFWKQTQTSWDSVKEILPRTNSLRETVRLQRELWLVADETPFAATFIKQQPSYASGWHEYQYIVAGQSCDVATNFRVVDVFAGT
jgi:hypothetical protein